MMVDLVCYNGKLVIGFFVSVLLLFWVCCDMFDLIVKCVVD